MKYEQLKKLIISKANKRLNEIADKDNFRITTSIGEVNDGYNVLQSLAQELNVNPRSLVSAVQEKYHYPSGSEPVEYLLVVSSNFCDTVEAVVEDMGLDYENEVMSVFRDALEDYKFVCI